MIGRVWTLPNLLTLLRACAAVPVALAVRGGRLDVALAVVVVAGLTDGLDGLLARRTGQTSDVGRLLDPIADKLLLVTTFLSVSFPGAGFEPLPFWLAGLAMTRDVCIVLAAFAIYFATGFSGFTPTMLGKVNTCLEIGVVFLFLVTRLAGLPEAPLEVMIYVTGASIVVSGVHYVFHSRRQLASRT